MLSLFSRLHQGETYELNAEFGVLGKFFKNQGQPENEAELTEMKREGRHLRNRASITPINDLEPCQEFLSLRKTERV